jgi:hypothetical protein
MRRKRRSSHTSTPHPPSFQSLPDWLSVAQVRDYLGLGRDAVYLLFHRYHAVRFGNRFLLPKHVLDPHATRSEP